MTQFNDRLLQIETCKNFNDMLLHLAKYFMNGKACSIMVFAVSFTVILVIKSFWDFLMESVEIGPFQLFLGCKELGI